MKNSITTNRIGDEAVRSRTGRSWASWFEALDKLGARKMQHRDVAAYLREKHALSGWWSQMITVAYEQERGLRQVHQKPGGFEVTVTKTVQASLTDLYRAWEVPHLRHKWIRERFAVRRATPQKSLRLTWSDGNPAVSVNFYGNGSKSRVAVQHGRLDGDRSAKRMKKYWQVSLDEMKRMLEGK